jgi:hypothetical protein
LEFIKSFVVNYKSQKGVREFNRGESIRYIMEPEHISEVIDISDIIKQGWDEYCEDIESYGFFDADELLLFLKEMFGLEFDEEDLVFVGDDEEKGKGIYRILVHAKKKGKAKKPDKEFHYEVKREDNGKGVYNKDFKATVEIINYEPEETGNNQLGQFQAFDHSESDGDYKYSVKPINAVKITYDEKTPFILNGQRIYQSFFFENRAGSDIHESFRQIASVSGMDIEIEERGYIDERDGKRYVGKYIKRFGDIVDGSEINGERVFLEFYRNGEIVKDDLSVKKGDILEGRVGTETKNGCGGGGRLVKRLKYILENDNLKTPFVVPTYQSDNGILYLNRSDYFSSVTF